MQEGVRETLRRGLGKSVAMQIAMQEGVRETPAQQPLHRGPSSCHEANDREPVLEIEEIQGNILAGFNKDFQTLLFLRITEPEDFKEWLAATIPFIATTAEVLAFNRLFKAIRTRRNSESRTVQATWTNIALSFQGIQKLDKKGAAQFEDAAFIEGVAQRSESLGDPTKPEQEGHRSRWVVGGSERNEADVVLIVASDDRNDLFAEVARLETTIYAPKTPNGQPFRSGVEIIYKQHGAVLPPPLTGHEHFGFRDGVSQPGIRGLLSHDLQDVLTPRQNPANADQGKPGQDLLWPGEFVFGYPKQVGTAKKITEPGDIAEAGPEWARNGSFLVFRRLQQDVGGFHRFLQDTAADLNAKGFAVDANLFGANCVGRWTTGAPIMRAPDQDDPGLAKDDCRNNNFEFIHEEDAKKPDAGAGDGNEKGAALATSEGHAGANEEGMAGAKSLAGSQDVTATEPVEVEQDAKQVENADPCNPVQEDCLCPEDDTEVPDDRPGLICPFAGHIRKSYPRNDEFDAEQQLPDEKKQLSERTTQTHRLLRRGIPYGEPFLEEQPYTADAGDRGLLFLAYQTSIVNQFEFVTQAWVNNPDFRENEAGFDPIIGQNNKASDRARPFKVALKKNGKPELVEVTAPQDWVIPTGGGYFFSPSISALCLLTGRPPRQS